MEKRISSRAFIFKDNKIVLIYRERNNENYYVFPGGGLEKNESLKECVIREIKEELGLTINAKKQIYKVEGEDFIQYFYLCEWLDGELGSGDYEEYNPNRPGGLQKPMLIEISRLNELPIVSPKIVNQLLNDIKIYGLQLNDNIVNIKE